MGVMTGLSGNEMYCTLGSESPFIRISQIIKNSSVNKFFKTGRLIINSN